MEHKFLLILFLTTLCNNSILSMDGEEIPLEILRKSSSQRIKELPKEALEKRLLEFDHKIQESNNRRTWWKAFIEGDKLQASNYIASLEKEIPDALATEETITKLILNKNLLLGQAINQLINGPAYNHFKNVTADTLADITNPKTSHFTRSPLPYVVKKYVMNRAYSNITNQEKFNLPLKNKICWADIHATSNLLATAETEGSFTLYNLSTLQPKIIFPEKSKGGYVKFSEDGSLLATVVVTTNDPIAIDLKIRDTIFGNCLYSFTINCRISAIQINKTSENKFSLSIITPRYIHFCIVEDNKMQPPIDVPIGTPAPYYFTDAKGYTFPPLNNFDYPIQKLASASYILCNNAIEKTKNKSSLPQIKNSSAYKLLSILEKQDIDAKLNQKTESQA